MQRTRLHVGRTLVTLGLVAAGVGSPARTAAQGPERVLFLTPQASTNGDSAYAVELGKEVRRRMESKLRRKYRILTSDEITKVLTESGYSGDAVLGAEDAYRLAQAMRTDVYIVGTIAETNSTPVGRFRLVDIGNAGLAGWMGVRGTAGDPPRKFAQTIVDSLENQVKAAGHALDCIERRNRGEFENARKRAQRAFDMYPYHPSAAMCLEVVFEGLGQPADSQIMALEKAVRGDSLLTRAWERLGRLHQMSGDSLKALNAFRQQLAVVPADRQLRRGVVAGAITLKQYHLARRLTNEWLADEPDDLEFLQLKARACVEGGLWQCALDALSAEYDVDTTLSRDSIFFRQIIGAAQVLADSAALLRWSGEAVRNFPTSIGLWRAHAMALTEAGMNDSVVAVYGKLLELDPTDLRSALGAARILIDGLTIDTLTPIDTARLFRAGEYLNHVSSNTQDSTLLMNVAVLYFQPGSGMVQARQYSSLAIELLDSALTYDVQGRLTEQANFFQGLALFFSIAEFDEQVLATESCDLVDQEAQMIARAIEALRTGASVSPAAAEQLLPGLESYQVRIPTLREAFKC